MISTDFAPNESWDDARLSLKLLFQPWRWRSGKETKAVEQKIIKKFFPKYHIGTDRSTMVHLFLSGRSALYFLLRSFKLPAGSKVIVQAFTCEAVVLPVLANRLKPVYIDIETDTFSMNYRSLINRLTDNSRVLILQHTFGLTPKYRQEILDLAKKNKLIVIEDLAHGFNPSIFASSNYSLQTTNYFLLSFGRSKLLSSVFGGAIVSTDNRLTEQLKNLKYPSYWFIFRCLLYKPLVMLIKSTYDIYLGKILHKILNSLNLLIPEITPKEKKGNYDQIFNKAYPNALSILLLHQLNKFDQIQEQRARICRIYNRHLQTTNYELLTTNSSLIRYPLLVKNRSEVLAKARRKNIFLGKWYDQAVAPKDLDLGRVEYETGSCPKAEEACQKIINLPTNIREKEAERIVETLNDVTLSK